MAMNTVQLDKGPCLQIQADLSAMLDGELQPASVRRVMVHSDVCSSCRGFLDGIRVQARALQDLHEMGALGKVEEAGTSKAAALLRKKLIENRDHLAKIFYELGRGFVLMGVSPNFSRVVAREPVPIPDMCMRGRSLVDEVERMSVEGGSVDSEWVRAKELFENGRLITPAESLDKGTHLLRECLLLKSDFHEARIYLGHAYHVGEQRQKACVEFKAVLAAATDQHVRAFALLNLGNVYLEDGKWGASIPLFRELVDSGVIAKQPHFCMTFFNLALAYGLLEKFEECRHWFERLHIELPHKRSMIAGQLRSRRQLHEVLRRHPRIKADLALSFPDWFPIAEEADRE